MLTSYQFSNADENQAILEIDVNGRDLDEGAAEWIENNKSNWEPWIKAATQ